MVRERPHVTMHKNPKDGDVVVCWCGVRYRFVRLDDEYAGWYQIEDSTQGDNNGNF